MLTNSTTTKMIKSSGSKQASKAFNNVREQHPSTNNNKQRVGRLKASSVFDKRTIGVWE